MSGKKREEKQWSSSFIHKTHQAMNSKKRWTRAEGREGEVEERMEKEEEAVRLD